METSQPLSIESFSYSWLVNLNPPFESPNGSFRSSLDEASFIEMDPKLSPSKRFFRVAQDFNFEVSQPPLALVDADELISNGYLVPLFVKPSKIDTYGASDSAPTSPISLCGQENARLGSKIRCSSLRRCRRISKQIFQKYVNFLWPLCQRMRERRSGSRVGNVDSGIREGDGWKCSPAASPRVSAAYSADNFRWSCDSDSSIHEAVLHCKRTIGK
ncbi:hypothetical protein LguiA_031865 [Lonicera macranthoides]